MPETLNNYFQNANDLKKKLNLGEDFKIPEFKDLIYTKQELFKLKQELESLRNDDTKKEAHLAKFIKDKLLISKNSSEKRGELKTDLETAKLPRNTEKIMEMAGKGGLAAGAGFVALEMKQGLDEIKNEEGLSKIEKIFGFFGKISDSISNLFTGMKTWFAGKFPSIAKFFGIESSPAVGNILDKKDEIKQAVEQTKENLPTEKEIMDYKNSMTAKLEKQFKTKFSDDQKIRLHGIIDKHSKDLRKIKDEVSQGDIVFVDLGFSTGAIATMFMLDLVKEGIIPVSSIAMNFVDTGVNTIKIGIAPYGKLLGMEESEIVLGKLSMDTFGEMNLSDTQKQILLGIIYRKGGLVTNLMGQASYIASRLLIQPLEMGENISALSMSGNTLIGDYEKVAKNYDKMLKVLGQPGDDLAKTLRMILMETKAKTEVLSIYNLHGGDIRRFEQEISKLPQDTDFIKQVRKELSAGKIANESELGVKLSNLVKTNAKNSQDMMGALKGKISTSLKGVFGNKHYILDDFSSKMSKVNEGIEKSFRSGRTIFRYWHNFKNTFSMIELPKSFEKTVFSITKENSKDFVKQLKFLATQSPELIRGAFSHLPIIAVAGVAASSDEPFMKELAEGFKFLVPIFGPIFIMRQAKLEKWQPHDMMNIALGGGFLVYDIYAGVKVFKAAKTGEGIIQLSKFMAKPAVDVFRLGKGTLQTILAAEHGFKAVYELVKAGKIAEIGKVAEFGKLKQYGLIVGLLIIAGWGAKELFSKKPEEIIAQLEKEGFLNKDGGFNPDKISEKYSSMGKTEKKAIISYMTKAILSENSIAENHVTRDFGIEIKGNKAIITFKDIANIPEREAIRSNLAQIGVETNFSYEAGALADYAERLKKENRPFEEFKIAMNGIGIENPDKYWE